MMRRRRGKESAKGGAFLCSWRTKADGGEVFCFELSIRRRAEFRGLGAHTVGAMKNPSGEKFLEKGSEENTLK